MISRLHIRQCHYRILILSVWLAAFGLHLHAQTSQDTATSVTGPTMPLTADQGSNSHDSDETSDSIDSRQTSLRSSAGTGSGLRSGSTAFVRSTSLSTEDIFSILQEQPDALVELKALVADLAQQQGTPVQPDAITDEMLYSRIASSPQLRASVTNFLRTRGYVSDSEIQERIAASDDADSVQNSPFLLQGSHPPYDGGSSIGRMSDPYTGYENAQGLSALRDMAGGVNSPRAATDHGDDTLTQRTHEPRVLHRPTPYNLLSLRDLYTQLPEATGKLTRFGSSFFTRRDALSRSQFSPAGREIPLDVPAGPEYVVGPGDSLTIDLWGGISQSFTKTVDREGKISLPESGAVQIAGLTLERAQGVITETLKQQYRDVQVAVAIAHLRSIRIYVVGDVQRPGAYDISSLSTSLNALYAAGGPTAIGSLRVLRHYRAKQLVGEIDLYDFLLRGVQGEDRLLAGDTLLVPPAGPQVAVYGAVKRPAIYELLGNASLAEILQIAGGATVSAELGHIVIERIDPNHQRSTVSLDLSAASDAGSAQKAIAAFAVHDGDKVHVAAILPYSQRVIYTDGHVVRPGRMPYHDGMQLSDVLHSYQDLLPEPADRGEIVRLVPPDLHPETIEFNLPDILIGNVSLPLQPFDTVKIYGRYESDAPKVTIGGEVLRPGVYSLSTGMTAAQLVRMAGGFKRDALLENADLVSYRTTGGTKVVK